MDYSYKEYDCGCEIATDNMGAYEIQYCPKHKAAPDMYEALRRIAIEGKREDGKYDKFDAAGFVRIAEEAIAKVET